MATRKQADATQLESDAATILAWFMERPAQYVTSRMAAEALGLLPSNGRFRKAFALARTAAARMGHDLEDFTTSREPGTLGKPVTRLMLDGAGDEQGSRAAFHAMRRSIGPMTTAANTCEFQARNRVPEHGTSGEDPLTIAFEETAVTYRNAISSVEGWERMGIALVDQERQRRAMADRIRELEAQLAVSA